MSKRGLLIVVSAPSGCGKGTILEQVMKRQDFYYSISATTRAPRPGEKDKVNYFFMTKEQFENQNTNFDVQFVVYDGQLQITPSDKVTVLITGHEDSKPYNGAEQSVTGYDVEILTPEGVEAYTEDDFSFAFFETTMDNVLNRAASSSASFSSAFKDVSYTNRKYFSVTMMSLQLLHAPPIQMASETKLCMTGRLYFSSAGCHISCTISKFT